MRETRLESDGRLFRRNSFWNTYERENEKRREEKRVGFESGLFVS